MIGTFLGITAICLLIAFICGILLGHLPFMPDVLQGVCVIVLTASITASILGAIFVNPLVLLVHNDSYKKFKTEYELKMQLYNSATNKSDTIVILDIAEVNADLIEMQSEKKAWGRFCYYPDNILDYKLIGVKEKS